MARKINHCYSCDRPLNGRQKTCVCGAATRIMSFDERTQYELQLWRSHRDSELSQQTRLQA